MQRRNAGEGPVSLSEAARCAGSDLPGPKVCKLLDSRGLNKLCVQLGCVELRCVTDKGDNPQCHFETRFKGPVLFANSVSGERG